MKLHQYTSVRPNELKFNSLLFGMNHIPPFDVLFLSLSPPYDLKEVLYIVVILHTSLIFRQHHDSWWVMGNNIDPSHLPL